MRFFYEAENESGFTPRADGICGRGNDGGVRLELAEPCDRAGGRNERVGVFACVCGILGWNIVSAFIRQLDSAFT